MASDPQVYSGLALTFDGSELHAAAQAAKEFDRRMYTEMRRSLRIAASDVIKDIRQEIGRIPSSGKSGTGVRIALQRGTRASISVSKPKTAGVRIVTSGRYLPEGKKPLVKAMNLAEFRHPVYPKPYNEPHMWRSHRTLRARDYARSVGKRESELASWTWVKQPGRPYFGSVIWRNQNAVVRRLQLSMALTVRHTMREIERKKGIHV